MRGHPHPLKRPKEKYAQSINETLSMETERGGGREVRTTDSAAKLKSTSSRLANNNAGLSTLSLTFPCVRTHGLAGATPTTTPSPSYFSGRSAPLRGLNGQWEGTSVWNPDTVECHHREHSQTWIAHWRFKRPCGYWRTVSFFFFFYVKSFHVSDIRLILRLSKYKHMSEIFHRFWGI